MQNVAVFWDYENCPCPSSGSGYALVNSIRATAQKYGVIKSLRAYTAVAEQFSTAKAAVLRSELQCSGVSLVDCPHNGRKDVADKMIIVDMLAHAIDNAPSCTVIFLISGDRDFAYAMSILRLRCYTLILCAPNNAHTSLLAQASISIDWASVAVLPGACLNFSKQTNEESQRSIGQGPMASTPHSGEENSYNTPLHDVGVINPYLRHTVKHSDSFSSDPRGHSHDFGHTNQDYAQKSSANPMRYSLRRNSFDATYLNVQDNRMPDINSAACAPCHAPSIPDRPKETDAVFTSSNGSNETLDAVFPLGNVNPLDMNASQEAMGVSTSTRCATPEIGTSEPQVSSNSSSTVYHLPVITPLVVNQLGALDFPSIQIQSAKPSYSDLPDTRTTASTSNTTMPSAREVSASPGVSPSADIPSSESCVTESITSSTSAYVTAASQSASVSPEPTRQIPLPQFKVLVRILQLHRSKGVLMPTRSLVASQVALPANGNPYKQAGVDKWGQYAELARKEGIIELGGKEGAAWVALTPKWYNAHTT